MLGDLVQNTTGKLDHPPTDALPQRATSSVPAGHSWAIRRASGTGAGTPPGLDLRAVQVLLGHQSIATTERYCAVNDSEIRAAMEAAGMGA
jgi:integrase